MRAEQLAPAESFREKSPYDKHSERYLTITKHIFCSTNVPNSIVENAEFKSLIKVLDGRYPLPGKTLIGKELDKVLVTLKQSVQGFISQARKVSLCADIWSKRD